MNESYDPLEAELAALQPHDASPELRRRIADYRTRSAPPGSRLRWGIVVASGLAAACVAAAILLRWRSGPRVEPQPIVVVPPPAPSIEVEDAGPTLLAYQRALARSPEHLDALLNKHALVGPQPTLELARICVSTRSDAALHALLGED